MDKYPNIQAPYVGRDPSWYEDDYVGPADIYEWEADDHCEEEEQ